MPKRLDPGQPAFQLLDSTGVPDGPIVYEKPAPESRIPDGWMEIVKAAAEGRIVPMTDLHRWSGIPINELRATAAKEEWKTPTRVKDMAIKKVDKILSGLDLGSDLMDGLTGVETECLIGDREDDDNDEAFEVVTDGPELDLRHYDSTPKKYRPKDGELLYQEKETPSDAKSRTAALVAKLDMVRGEVREELSRRADIHQLAVSEITQVAMVNFMDRVQKDPMLAILYAKQFESLAKTARTNLKLDESKDPTAGARTVVIMSEPGFIPRPAISTVEAEVVEDEIEPIESGMISGET